MFQGFTAFLCWVHLKDGDTEAHQEKLLLEGAVVLTAKLFYQPRTREQGLAFRAERSGSQVWYGGQGFSDRCGYAFPR